MLPASTTRGWHIDQMRKSIRILSDILKTLTPEAATTYRDGGSGWTATEVMCHLRDAEVTFFERARSTVEADGGSVPSPNADELAKERLYNEQSIATVYEEWLKERQAHLAFLEGVEESAWTTNNSIHPRRGPMNLSDQLALTAWHDINHVEQMMRTLAEKQTE